MLGSTYKVHDGFVVDSELYVHMHVYQLNTLNTLNTYVHMWVCHVTRVMVVAALVGCAGKQDLGHGRGPSTPR